MTSSLPLTKVLTLESKSYTLKINTQNYNSEIELEFMTTFIDDNSYHY